MTRNALGLSITESKETIEQLNTLLSGFQIYYQNLRGLHWNIRGKRFFELHQKFEELYNDAQLKIDEVAERILTLGGRPIHTFEAYLKTSTVIVGKDISKDEDAVSLIVNSLRELLPLERDILAHTDAINDEGTNAMMSDFISEQEKTIWMMQAWQDETV
jgi:starvation-inducible DNA-binding protein